MSTLAYSGPLDLVDLTPEEMEELDGGIPWVPLGGAVGAYLLKTVGDNWGEFKKGVREGFKTIWGAAT
jgi:hypothetical protein